MSVDTPGYGYWFGEPWPSDELRAPICDDDLMRVPVPVGQPCLFCHEPVQPGDRGVLMPSVMREGTSVEACHIECQFANDVGGAAHIDGGHCEHCGGAGDDPYAGHSRRESSLKVWNAWNTIGTY